MLFVEWWLVRRFCLSLLAIAAAALLFWLVRRRTPRMQILLKSLAWPLAAFGTLFFLLNLLAVGCQSYLPPVYSPNGKIAARVRSADEGFLGSEAAVELFTSHGLVTRGVFRGPWESVGGASLRWKSDSELEIYYQDNVFYCGRGFGVSVHCMRRPESDE